MRRIIKFRVWDKVRKIIWNDNDISMMFIENGKFTPLFDTGSEHLPIADDEDIIVMQYTGLKDKNGKEICEDDIIEHDRGTRWQVVFKRGCFKVANIEHPIANLYLLSEAGLDSIEVIGNIYENPEFVE